jgi:hypothetical protein
MKVFVFYTVSSTVIALIAQAAHAGLAVTLMTSLLIPPVILLIYRLLRL